ncbi:MAG: hypothetical protein ACI82Q_003038 [Nonlabens sp.]|jgi:hypothetical protein
MTNQAAAASSNKFDPTVASPAEFSKIPLDFIISAPLMTTIEAHKTAAQTTLDFVKSMATADPVDFEFEETVTDAAGVIKVQKRSMKVPMLALVKVPSLNFDSLSVSFQYNISQVVTEKNATNKAAKAEIATKGLLAKFVGASLNGSISNTSSNENTVNRGGTLDIKLHVSESALPAGLQKVINAMVEGIEAPAQNP